MKKLVRYCDTTICDTDCKLKPEHCMVLIEAATKKELSVKHKENTDGYGMISDINSTNYDKNIAERFKYLVYACHQKYGTQR